MSYEDIWGEPLYTPMVPAYKDSLSGMSVLQINAGSIRISLSRQVQLDNNIKQATKINKYISKQNCRYRIYFQVRLTQVNKPKK